MTPLVIYHGHCRDGFCSAWVASQILEDAEFFAANYGDPSPIGLVEGRDVYVLDFCYPREQMEAIALSAKSLVVLDHHKTAQEALAGFEHEFRFRSIDVTVVFDMERSGAGITWDWFRAEPRWRGLDPARPWLVDYVEDRDLWRFALPDSEIVNAYIAVLPFEFKAWNDALADGTLIAVSRGATCQEKMRQYIRETLAANAQLVEFDGEIVPLVNAPKVDISELVRELLDQTDDAPFAMGFSQANDGRFVYALRSKEGVDVSEVAKRHGGGGHAQAAGFVSEEIAHRHVRRATLESR